MINNTAKVLDKGFVKLLNLAGPTPRTNLEDKCFDASDIDPAQAARLSFEQMGEERSYAQDMKLNEYLLVNQHTSPFEMIQVWIEVKVPIFVDRQLVRHRTWRRNESSGRYITLPADWYIPDIVGGKPLDKKQGQSDNLASHIQNRFRVMLNEACAMDYVNYKNFIAQGVAAEHARMFLHLNHYVHWLGNIDLHNLFHFLRLRAHTHAQVEAQAYANAIIDLLRPHLPGLMELFDKHVRK
jgi:thymidylate synthase (FAD)